MKETLSHCPHCGNIPQGVDAVYKVGFPLADGTQLWRAGCVESAGGCGSECLGYSREEAIERWQARVEPNASLASPERVVPDAWVDAVQEFVDRVERGEVRSKKTYAKFQSLLASLKSNTGE